MVSHLRLPAALVRKVAELVSGLEALGCGRTKGEDQTLCIFGDSFDSLGDAESLQASGELPVVDVITVRIIRFRLKQRLPGTLGSDVTAPVCRPRTTRARQQISHCSSIYILG